MRHAAIALVLLLAQQSPRPAFEVATIKRNVAVVDVGTMGFEPGGRFRAVKVPPLWLISTAYGESQHPLFEWQIEGAPAWLQSEYYDITAKAGPDVALLPPQEAFRKIPILLRSLLEERFALRAHRETRQLPIYALTFSGKSGVLGPRLTRSTLDCMKELARCGFNGGNGHITAGWITVEMLANRLSNATQRLVVDRTGLSGRFDVELEWSPDQSTSDKPSLFTALDEQLGLKLESVRAPVDVLVIDHVERPTED